MNSKKRIFFIAGEVSGDLHGANLMRAWNKQSNNFIFKGWGGDRMEAEGMLLLKHVRSLSFMGFLEVLMNLRTILGNIKTCKKEIKEFQPDALVLIDFPGFNLRIASWAKEQGIPVIYYISPQIWAWKASRVHAIKRDVSQLYCILPFEKSFYETYDYPVKYLGHPLLDEVMKFKEEAHPPLTLLSDRKILALLPGSRAQEVKRKLPNMIAAAKSFPDYEIVVACSTNLSLDFYKNLVTDDTQLVFGQTYSILEKANLALVTSGTATLETALFEVPQVVCYATSPISFRIAKLLVKIKFISLVNLILDQELVKELIQGDCTSENMVHYLKKLEEGTSDRSRLLSNYKILIKSLGNQGASDRVAADILETFFAK